MKKIYWIPVLGIVALSLASCKGNARKPTFAVTGKVEYRTKPLAHATVVLHPIDETGPHVVKPRGTTEADGSFKLTTYDSKDGAPAGEYLVTVELWLSSGRGDEGPTSRLPARYSRPETSGLRATVVGNATLLPPIQLK